MTTPLPQLRPPTPECTECELHEFCESPGLASLWFEESLSPTTPGAPVLVCVGINPGAADDASGGAFHPGKGGGEILRSTYLRYAKEEAIIYGTFSARCYTPHPMKAAARHHKTCSATYLKHDLEAIADFYPDRPIHIWCLGAPPVTTVWRILGDQRQSLKNALQQQATPLGRFMLFATYNPNFVAMKPNILYAVDNHQKLLVRQLRGEAPTLTEPVILRAHSPTNPPPQRTTP